MHVYTDEPQSEQNHVRQNTLPSTWSVQPGEACKMIKLKQSDPEFIEVVKTTRVYPTVLSYSIVSVSKVREPLVMHYSGLTRIFGWMSLSQLKYDDIATWKYYIVTGIETGHFGKPDVRVKTGLNNYNPKNFTISFLGLTTIPTAYGPE